MHARKHILMKQSILESLRDEPDPLVYSSSIRLAKVSHEDSSTHLEVIKKPKLPFHPVFPPSKDTIDMT